MTIKDRWAGFAAKVKGARKSLTIAFNAGIGTVIGQWDQIKSSFSDMEPYMTADNFRRLMFVAVLVNIALRFRTSQGLHEK